MRVNDNSATRGGALYIDKGTSTLRDCILWGDNASSGLEIYVYWGTVNISYSDVEGGEASLYVDAVDAVLNWGDGMIEADPFFVIGPDGDHYLLNLA